MLLNKCAPLRCSTSELLELPELKDRIKRFTHIEERKSDVPKCDHFNAYREAIAKKQTMLKLQKQTKPDEIGFSSPIVVPEESKISAYYNEPV
jgi:hypothetical protein